MPTMIALATLFAVVLSAPASAQTTRPAGEPAASPAVAAPGITKILRGQLKCIDTAANNAPCGMEYWTMYVHTDRSRYMHVAGDSYRAGEARHAMVWVEPGGGIREAFMHNWSRKGSLGAAYVVLKDQSADVAASDRAFERAKEGLIKENVEAFDKVDSIGVGPASVDGLHFLKFNFRKPKEQPHGVYWMGGSRHGTMVGNFVTSEYTYLGEVKTKLPDGTAITADHFRMLSGTEVWVTKEDRVMLRMDLKFGEVTGSRFDLVDYSVTTVGK